MAGTSLLRIGFTLGVLASLFSPTTSLATQPKVLVVVRSQIYDRELSITKELAVMLDMLKKAGFTPVVASGEGKVFEYGEIRIASDLKFADVVVSDYAAVLMPCMSNPEGGWIQSELVKLVADAAAAGKPIAAQRSSLYILSEAGLLKGRRYAYAEDRRRAYATGRAPFPEGIHAGEGIVQDGNIITSAFCPNGAKDFGKPDGTAQLTEELIKVLKAG